MATAAANLDTGLLGEFQESLSANLPDDWEFTTLGEAFKWGSGGTPKRTNPAFFGGNIPWLIIGDLDDRVVTESETSITDEGLANSSAKLVTEGSVLLAMYGSIGKLGIAGRELTTNQAIAFTKPEEDDAKYLFYYLMFVRNKLARLGKGATQKNISQTVIKAFPYVRAPLEQQPRIVAEIEKQFSRLDEAVASLKRVKANLKRYKAAVLKAAVEGKLTEEWCKHNPDVEPASKLLERILVERRTKWEEAELAKMKAKGKEPKNDKWKERFKSPIQPSEGAIEVMPKHWVAASLDMLCPLFVDSPHRTPKYSKSGFPALRPRDVVNGALNLEKAARVTTKEYKTQTARHEPRPGDIVYSRELSFGWGAVIPPDVELCLSQGMCVFRPHSSVFVKYFTYLLNGPLGRQQAENAATGSAHPHINLGDIKSYSFPLAPKSEQAEIVARLDALNSAIAESERQVDFAIRRGNNLRQQVLSLAFSGRLAITDSIIVKDTVDFEQKRQPTDHSSKEVRPEKVSKSRGVRVKKRQKRTPLNVVLKEHKLGCAPEELLEQAGYDAGDIGQIEDFYHELAKLKSKIVITKPEDTEALDWPLENQVVIKLR